MLPDPASSVSTEGHTNPHARQNYLLSKFYVWHTLNERLWQTLEIHKPERKGSKSNAGRHTCRARSWLQYHLAFCVQSITALHRSICLCQYGLCIPQKLVGLFVWREKNHSKIVNCLLRIRSQSHILYISWYNTLLSFHITRILFICPSLWLDSQLATSAPTPSLRHRIPHFWCHTEAKNNFERCGKVRWCHKNRRGAIGKE